MSKRIALFPTLLLAVLFVAACWLTWVNFSVALPRSQWQQAIWSPDINAIEQMVFHYSLLPGWGWSVSCFSRCCVTHWQNPLR